jgi:multiple sugar transport system ATP-binding protein
MPSLAQFLIHYGSSGTYLPVERKCGVATVSFSDATRVYPGADHPSVDKLNLDIGDGEFMVLVGPSGCGKSTSLRMLAGLEEVNSGSILIGDRDVTDLPPKDRDIAMVFQNYALYPHMTVGDNMGFALKMAGIPKAERQQRVQEAAHLLGLEDFLNRKPKALSGGQRQRVAMGRAIVRSPQVFLMDEPLSNLDAKLRVSTRTQIAALQTRLGVTTVYVTHDQVEAMTMGDRVAVMKDGVLQQCDTPLSLYDKPKNLFVAGFIGSPAMNLMEGAVVEDGVKLGDYVVPVPRDTLAKASGEKSIMLGIRPENFQLGGDDGIPIDVAVTEELGADAFVYGTLSGLADDEQLTAQQIVGRVSSRTPPQRGTTVRLTIDPSHVHAFSQKTGDRISG